MREIERLRQEGDGENIGEGFRLGTALSSQLSAISYQLSMIASLPGLDE